MTHRCHFPLALTRAFQDEFPFNLKENSILFLHIKATLVFRVEENVGFRERKRVGRRRLFLMCHVTPFGLDFIDTQQAEKRVTCVSPASLFDFFLLFSFPSFFFKKKKILPTAHFPLSIFKFSRHFLIF